MALDRDKRELLCCSCATKNADEAFKYVKTGFLPKVLDLIAKHNK